MMNPLLLSAVVVTAIALTGVTVNELGHGMVAEMMGLGHRHMFDNGGMHCAPHDDERHGEAHMSHMHGDAAMPHADCAGGPGMHGGGGMHQGGARA